MPICAAPGLAPLVSPTPCHGLQLRPARAGDAPAMQAFVDGLSVRSRRLRFHGGIAHCSPALAQQLVCAGEGGSQVIWLAWLPAPEHGRGHGHGHGHGHGLVQFASALPDAARPVAATLVGEARLAIHPQDQHQAELAMAVADAQHGCGVASALLQRLILSAQQAGIDTLFGEVLHDNTRMQAFLQRHAFSLAPLDDSTHAVRLQRVLAPAGAWDGQTRTGAWPRLRQWVDAAWQRSLTRQHSRA